MKTRPFALILIVAMIIGLAGLPQPVKAAAYGSHFITSITYMNIGDAEAQISFRFYSTADSTPITISRPNLPVFAASSLYVGSLSDLSDGFQGSGVIDSNQPLAATLVQVPASGSTVKNRPLSNAFTGGASVVTIPTALKNMYNTNSMISIQNVDSDSAADLTVEFIPTSGATITDTVTNLPSGSAKYYDLGTTSVISAGSFNGAIRITAKKAGTSNDGAVVATSLEMLTNNDNTYSFEGTSDSGTSIYMPSAFCNWGAGQVNSAYAVQNTSTTDNADVTVNYSNGSHDGPYTIAPGAKKSFQGCGVPAGLNPAGFLGAATITSTGANISAIGKITGGGYSTAFNGFSRGFEKVVLPYVRFTTNHWEDGTSQRVYIAIQNVGGSEVAANSVSVKYYNAQGTLVGTINNPNPIAVGSKWSTDASSIDPEFGYSSGTGGGALIEGPSGAQLAVIARAETYLTQTTTTAEDYNGIEYIPLN